MFFIMGITDGRKDFDFHQMMTCGACIKWNRHYYVQASCCNALYELDAEIGKRIACGGDVEILPQHLRPVHPGNRGNGWNTTKQCRNCGFTTTEDYEFCPKCGLRF